MPKILQKHKVLVLVFIISGLAYLVLSIPSYGQPVAHPAPPTSPTSANHSATQTTGNGWAANLPSGVNFPLPTFTVGIGNTNNRHDVGTALQVLFLLTVVTLAPSILVLTTGFTRMIIVLSLTRSAIGTQQMPPNAVLVGLALFLTMFVMAPVGKQINDTALQPYMKGTIDFQTGVNLAQAPLRDFMFKQTRRKDLGLFLNVAKSTMCKPRTMSRPTFSSRPL